MDFKSKPMILTFVIVVVAIAAGFWYWQQTKKQAVLPIATPTPGGLGSDLYQNVENPGEKLPEIDPLGNKPDTNPLSETNPFKNVKTNPF